MTYSTVLHDGMPLAYILDVEWYCNGFLEEQGEPRAEHASADDYEIDDLVDMFEHTECPLHIIPDYPAVPAGVWKRQANQAGEALDRLTEGNTGEPILPGVRNSHYQATTDELRDLWRRFPHARWIYERDAKSGVITIDVVDR